MIVRFKSVLMAFQVALDLGALPETRQTRWHVGWLTSEWETLTVDFGFHLGISFISLYDVLYN